LASARSTGGERANRCCIVNTISIDRGAWILVRTSIDVSDVDSPRACALTAALASVFGPVQVARARFERVHGCELVAYTRTQRHTHVVPGASTDLVLRVPNRTDGA
jgi:hypothetical protein